MGRGNDGDKQESSPQHTRKRTKGGRGGKGSNRSVSKRLHPPTSVHTRTGTQRTPSSSTRQSPLSAPRVGDASIHQQRRGRGSFGPRSPPRPSSLLDVTPTTLEAMPAGREAVAGGLSPSVGRRGAAEPRRRAVSGRGRATTPARDSSDAGGSPTGAGRQAFTAGKQGDRVHSRDTPPAWRRQGLGSWPGVASAGTRRGRARFRPRQDRARGLRFEKKAFPICKESRERGVGGCNH